MPTQEHDVLAGIFRWRPWAAVEVIDRIGVPLPGIESAVPVSESCVDLKTTPYAADAVVLLEGSGGRLAVIVEVQRRPDEGKWFTWPLYLHTLRAREKCSAMLLVIAPDPRTADRCGGTIETGHPGHTLTPLVLKPDHIRVMTDAEEIAADPALGVLSAMFHSTGPDAEKVLRAILPATDRLARGSEDEAQNYYGYVKAVLPEMARKTLEEIMKTEAPDFYESELAKDLLAAGEFGGEARGEARGEAKGEAKAVLTVLRARGIEVDDETRERILACTDIEQLDIWVARAATVGSAEEIFV
jgi:hypothetical protein